MKKLSLLFACLLYTSQLLPAADSSISSFNLRGEANLGVLKISDGANDSREWFLADKDQLPNGSGGTFLRLEKDKKVNEDLQISFYAQVQLEAQSTAKISQTEPTKSDLTDIVTVLMLETALKSKKYGTFYLGKGPTSSDGFAGIDNSGTFIASSSSTYALAGAMLLVKSDKSFSSNTVQSAFDSFDGIGKLSRIRYDTPTFKNTILSVSAVHEGAWDANLFYDRDFSGFNLNLGISYSQVNMENTTQGQYNLVNGSFTLLHKDSGFSLTAAGAQKAIKESTQSKNPNYIYVKLAKIFNKDNSGFWAASVDHFNGKHYNSDESTSYAYGATLLRNVKNWSMDFYVTGKIFKFEETSQLYQDMGAVLVGTHYMF